MSDSDSDYDQRESRRRESRRQDSHQRRQSDEALSSRDSEDLQRRAILNRRFINSQIHDDRRSRGSSREQGRGGYFPLPPGFTAASPSLSPAPSDRWGSRRQDRVISPDRHAEFEMDERNERLFSSSTSSSSPRRIGNSSSSRSASRRTEETYHTDTAEPVPIVPHTRMQSEPNWPPPRRTAQDLDLVGTGTGTGTFTVSGSPSYSSSPSLELGGDLLQAYDTRRRSASTRSNIIDVRVEGDLISFTPRTSDTDSRSQRERRRRRRDEERR